MKKFLSIILSLSMVLAMTTSAFASIPKTTSQQINEFEALAELANETQSELSRSGYNAEEIASIKNYRQTYADHITSLNNLSDEALSNHGYTNKQIDTIRNFTGTDSEMNSLGAKLTIYGTPGRFKYGPNQRTTGKLAYSWYWTGVPAFKRYDMVAVSWNDWKVTSETSNVRYYGVNTGEFLEKDSCIYTEPENEHKVAGAGHKFKMQKQDNAYFAKEGNGAFDIQSDALVPKDFFYYIEYGHTRLATDIGFSVGAGGADGSITFTVKTIEAGSDSGEWLVPEGAK